MSEAGFTSTVFEDAWHHTDNHIFRSERHQVMAIADIAPRLPLQVVVAHRSGYPGRDVGFSDLSTLHKRKLNEVAGAVGEKMAKHITEGQRVITHSEGFGVPDHPHIVLFAAARKEGERLYNGPPLGAIAVQNTIEVVKFTPVEAESLEARLDHVV
ncbi:MAG: hypothetical protein R3313_04605, partial [Candidatus Saccharimonadales bacterium]|nr:hypothetical protein [Candidatus Saccharimonadales bacterium]